MIRLIDFKKVAKETQGIYKDVVEALTTLDEKKQSTQNDTRLSQEAKKGDLTKLQQEREETIKEYSGKVQELFDKYLEDITEQTTLKGEDVTSDNNLFTGHLVTSASELEDVYKRATSYTMKLACMKYGEDNDIKSPLIEVASRAENIEMLEDVTVNFFRNAISRIEYADTWLSEKYLEEITA